MKYSLIILSLVVVLMQVDATTVPFDINNPATQVVKNGDTITFKTEEGLSYQGGVDLQDHLTLTITSSSRPHQPAITINLIERKWLLN